MEINSINVGRPQVVQWQGQDLKTSIFKSPVVGSVRVGQTNLEGDQQSDLAVHGGITRAVSIYASEYYEFWKKELEVAHLPWGYFGENLNISGGMFEEDIHVGDRFEVGSVELEATQPRFPCHKLAMKMGDKKWVKFFLHSRKTGFYVKVLKQGTIAAGDEIHRTHVNKGISMDEITDLYLINKRNKPLLEKALAVKELTDSWREYFQKQLDSLS